MATHSVSNISIAAFLRLMLYVNYVIDHRLAVPTQLKPRMCLDMGSVETLPQEKPLKTSRVCPFRVHACTHGDMQSKSSGIPVTPKVRTVEMTSRWCLTSTTMRWRLLLVFRGLWRAVYHHGKRAERRILSRNLPSGRLRDVGDCEVHDSGGVLGEKLNSTD